MTCSYTYVHTPHPRYISFDDVTLVVINQFLKPEQPSKLVKKPLGIVAGYHLTARLTQIVDQFIPATV
jgi:hypothetical protein